MPLLSSSKKSVNFSNVDQLGIVVRDIGEAMRNFARLYGVRTWYRNKRNAEKPDIVYYRGAQIKQENDMVLGYCGRVQLELVQPGGGEESIYTTHLEQRGEGLHHLGFYVPDLDARVAAYAAMGVEPVQTCELYAKGGAVTRCAYMDSAESNGVMIEMIETRMAGMHVRMKPVLLKAGALMGDLEKIDVKT